MNVGSRKEAGFAALEAVVIVVMVILIVLAGWWVYQNSQDDEATEEITPTQVEDEDSTPAIESAEDLEGTEQYLQDLKIEDDLDTSELDNTLHY